jgi:hypothetical protein
MPALPATLPVRLLHTHTLGGGACSSCRPLESADNSLHARALAEAKVHARMPALPAALEHTHTLGGGACSSCRPLESADNSLHARVLAEAKVHARMPTLPAALVHTHTHSGGVHAQAVAHSSQRTTPFTPALLPRQRPMRGCPRCLQRH